MKESPAVLRCNTKTFMVQKDGTFFQAFSDASMIREIFLSLFIFKDNPVI